MLDLVTAADSLETGLPFAAVLHDDVPTRQAALRDAVAAAGAGVRIIRAGPTAGSPLTIDRLTQQLSAARTDGLAAANGTIRQLCAPGAGERRSLLVVDQAETLDGATLRALQAAGLESRHAEQPLQVLFVGAPAFLALLRDPDLALIRYTVMTDAPEPEGFAAAPASVPPDLPAGWLTPAPMPQRQPGLARLLSPVDADAKPERNRHAMQAALVLTTAMLSAMVSWREPLPEPMPDQAPTYTVSSAEAPGLPAVVDIEKPSQDAPVVLQPSVALAPSPEPTVQPVAAQPPAETGDALLQREFDAFVRTSGDATARLTEPQRKVLFAEFVQWRARSPAGLAASKH